MNQFELNKEIEQLIQKKDKAKQDYSEKDKQFIAQYEGSGGQGSKGATGEGVLYEFFTPDYICELMWKLLTDMDLKEQEQCLNLAWELANY